MATRLTKTDRISLNVDHGILVRSRFDRILMVCEARQWPPTYVNVMALAFIEAKSRILSADKSLCMVDEVEFQCFLLISKWTYDPVEMYMDTDIGIMCIMTSHTVANVSRMMAHCGHSDGTF